MDKGKLTSTNVWMWTQRIGATLAIALALIAFYQWLTSFIEPWRIWFWIWAVSVGSWLWMRQRGIDSERKKREDLAGAIDVVSATNRTILILLYMHVSRENPEVTDRLIQSIPADEASQAVIKGILDDPGAAV